MGHLLNRCPLVDDRLRQLLQEEVTNAHQPVLPTTTTIVPNVSILGIQAMNPIGHMVIIHVNY
jgi:hypothetical protein